MRITSCSSAAGCARRSSGRSRASPRHPLRRAPTINGCTSSADDDFSRGDMQSRWVRAGMLWLAMAACIGQAWPADPDLVTLNFVNADIDGVVKAVSEITGKNFVLDPRVKGTVNIVSARPMSRALVYEVF